MPHSRVLRYNYSLAMFKEVFPPESEKAVRLRAALELMSVGNELMRQTIRRHLPEASPERVESELRRWLIDQPQDFLRTLRRES